MWKVSVPQTRDIWHVLRQLCDRASATYIPPFNFFSTYNSSSRLCSRHMWIPNGFFKQGMHLLPEAFWVSQIFTKPVFSLTALLFYRQGNMSCTDNHNTPYSFYKNILLVNLWKSYLIWMETLRLLPIIPVKYHKQDYAFRKLPEAWLLPITRLVITAVGFSLQRKMRVLLIHFWFSRQLDYHEVTG